MIKVFNLGAASRRSFNTSTRTLQSVISLSEQLLSSSSSQHHNRHCREILPSQPYIVFMERYQSKITQRPVLLSKFVTPFTDTMSFVNDKSTQLSVFVDFGEEFAKGGFGS